MIRLGHIIYKADNLYKSVEFVKGFTVEFGLTSPIFLGLKDNFLRFILYNKLNPDRFK